MGIELLALRLLRPLSKEEFVAAWELVPPQRRTRMAEFREKMSGYEQVCAYALLWHKLSSLYGWEEWPDIDYYDNGKPFFPDVSDVHFNISHTRGAVLVGVHNEPLGVDIEYIRPLNEKIKRRFQITDERDFFAEWVRKESIGKLRGTGVAALWQQELLLQENERVLEFETFPNYAACVATRAKNIDYRVKVFVWR